MRSETSKKIVTVRMRGTSLNPTLNDKKEIDKAVDALSEECAECKGQVFLRHNKKNGYKTLEVVCQTPVRLIEDER